MPVYIYDLEYGRFCHQQHPYRGTAPEKDILPTRAPKIRSPKIRPLNLPALAPAEGGDVRGGGHYEARRFTDVDFGDNNLAGASFVECELIGVQAGESQLQAARFSESRLDRLNAPALAAARSGWSDVHIANSRLGAVELFDADFRAVHIADSRLMFVNLRSAQMRDVKFTACAIDELDLTGAKVERMAFEDCTVQTLRLDHAVLRDVDLRGADLEAISGVDAMKGAAISTIQAMDLASLFAKHLGIAIID